MAQIIDTHTHFFDPHRPQGVPWPQPETPDLYRTTLPEHFLSVAAAHGVTHTVVVEASPWLEDNQWILDLADNPQRIGHRAIAGFVGNLRPDDISFHKYLDRFGAHPLFRGIRLGRDALDVFSHAELTEMVGELASLHLALDLLVEIAHLQTVADLCAAVPEAHVVINHVGHVPIDGAAPDKAWSEGMAALSQAPHVYCKISGLVENAGPQPAPTEVDFYAPTLDALWECFGAKRLLYASNWPVCRKGGSYATVFAVARTYVEQHGSAVIKDVFCDNALACYRLPPLR